MRSLFTRAVLWKKSVRIKTANLTVTKMEFFHGHRKRMSQFTIFKNDPVSASSGTYPGVLCPFPTTPQEKPRSETVYSQNTYG